MLKAIQLWNSCCIVFYTPNSNTNKPNECSFSIICVSNQDNPWLYMSSLHKNMHCKTVLDGRQPSEVCRLDHRRLRASVVRDENPLPRRSTYDLQPRLRTCDLLENMRLHLLPARVVKTYCQHIWKLDPAPMRWRAVAHHLVGLTIGNQVKQLGRPQITVRLRCGILKHEGDPFVSKSSTFRSRLHGNQWGKQALGPSNRIVDYGMPKGILVRAGQCSMPSGHSLFVAFQSGG